MTAHDLAKKLLEMPNLEVMVYSQYSESTATSVQVIMATEYQVKFGYRDPRYILID